jgi:hypothetical protein
MATFEELRLAHRRLLAAHVTWIGEFRDACRTPRYEDLIPVARSLDEAFKRFWEASESIRLEVETLPRRQSRMALERERRIDLDMTNASFAAIAKSFAILNRDAASAASVGYQALLDAASAYQRLAMGGGGVIRSSPRRVDTAVRYRLPEIRPCR